MITVTLSPFNPKAVVVQERDQALLLSINGEPMRIVKSVALTPRRKDGCYFIKEVPLVYVEPKQVQTVQAKDAELTRFDNLSKRGY